MTKRCPECRYKMEQHGIIENNDVYYCDVCGVYLSYPLEEDDEEELLYASEDEDKVPCSFCSEPIGTVKEVYEDETVDYEVANGEPVCISCYKDWIQEWKNDLDMHYTPFHAESFRADEEFYEEYPAKYYQTDEDEGVFHLPATDSYWVVSDDGCAGPFDKEESQKFVFGAEAGKYHITWKDGKKGVTFDFEGGDDMHFDDTWTDLFWDASNPQVTESSKKKRRWFGAEKSADDWYGLKNTDRWSMGDWEGWTYEDDDGMVILIDGPNGSIYKQGWSYNEEWGNKEGKDITLEEGEAYLKRKGIPYGKVYRGVDYDSVQFTHPKEECYKHDWSNPYFIESSYERDIRKGWAMFEQRCNYVLCDAKRRGSVGGEVSWEDAEDYGAEDFNAVVIAPEKPKGAVEKAMMNHYLLKEGELRLALEVLENEVQLGIISEREAHKRLQKILQSHMERRYSETTASTAGKKTLTSGVFMLISVASLWRAVTVTENEYLFPNEKKWMSILGSAAIGLGILALKGDSILAAVGE